MDDMLTRLGAGASSSGFGSWDACREDTRRVSFRGGGGMSGSGSSGSGTRDPSSGRVFGMTLGSGDDDGAGEMNERKKIDKIPREPASGRSGALNTDASALITAWIISL